MWSRLRRFNWISFLAMLALVAVGTLAIWSAGSAREGEVFHGMWKAHLQTAAFGLALYFALAWTDYRRILDWGALPAYLAAVALLVVVLAVGSSVYGGRRWLWFFQPSEVAKRSRRSTEGSTARSAAAPATSAGSRASCWRSRSRGCRAC